MSDLQLLAEAARAAGALMMAMRGQVAVRDKADGSPVTEADLAVDALLKQRLTGARPPYGWLSEETADAPARLGCGRVFVVDPIDGTSAFVQDKPWFCTSIAVVEDGVPVAGAVYAPLSDELFLAEAGGGATLNGAEIRVSDTAELQAARVVGDPHLLKPPRWPPMQVKYRNALAYRMSLVADGRFDAAIAPKSCREWDIAAGSVIAAEAGAIVCDTEGAPLRFNTPRARTTGLVCCAPALAPLILARAAANRAATAPTETSAP